VHADRPVWLAFAREGFPVYEIVVRLRQREEVIETVDSLEIAWTRIQAYKRQRLMAYFRPTVRRAPSIPPYVVHSHNTRDAAVRHAVER
jgi:hypothetical protein